MKHLSIILALLLLLSVFASCGGEQSADHKAVDTTADPSSTTEAETENPYGDDLPEDLDFEGEKVRVLIFENGNDPSNGWCCYIDMDESNGEILNDSAVQRNMEVETRLNVEIECIDGSGVVDRVAKSVTAGEDAYDIAIPFSTEILTKLITSNMLYDVSSLPHIDLSKPYYTKDSYETYEINGRHYLFSGAYTYPLYSTVSWLFNKDEWKNRGIDDAYQTVYDGKWTLDYVSAVIKDTYIDLDGDGKKGNNDFYGFTTVVPYMLSYIYYGCGMKGVSLESDGFKFDYGDEMTSKVMDKIIALGNHPDAKYYKSGWDNFFAGNSLMLLYGSSLPGLRQLEFDFGMLPMPKYDETQDDYVSYMCGGITCVPSAIQRPELVGAAVEALFSSSGRYMVDAFIMNYAEQKVLRDDHSITMFRLINTNVKYDFTRYISPSKKIESNELINKVINKGENVLASEWAKIQTSVEAEFADFYENYCSG
ncbi:MAG: hypothetical protein GX897_05965 [Clostridiales bacterium]|nr:hypothetical protein [Clostridiales bacterium]